MKNEKLQFKIKNFKNRIHEIVKQIPQGRVMSYKKVAQRAGRPRAWRAVGNILSKNKNPEVPCHRVIKSDGKIGGYNKGAKKKKALLKEDGYFI